MARVVALAVVMTGTLVATTLVSVRREVGCTEKNSIATMS